MKKKKLALFVLFIIFHLGYAQVNKIAIEDSIGKYLYNDPDIAIEYLNTFLKQNIESGDIKNQALIYSTLAICHDLKSNIDSTFYYYHKSLSIVKTPKDIVQLKYNIGLTYEKTYSYEEALQMYSQCLEIANDIQIKKSIDNIKLSIAGIKSKIGKPDEALELLKDIYSDRKKDNHPELKFTRKELAETYLKTNNETQALKLINEGLNEARLLQDFQMLYYLYELKYRFHFIKNEFEASKVFLDSAKSCALKLNNFDFLERSNYSLSRIYNKQSKNNLAAKTLNEILVNSRIKKPEQMAKYYKLLGIVYKDMDSLSLSSEYYQRFISENEKVSKKRIETLDKIHSIKFDEEVKQKEQIEQNKTYWTVSTAGLFLLALFLLFRHIKNGKRNQVRFENLMQKINVFEEKQLKEQHEIKVFSEEKKLSKTDGQETKTSTSTVKIKEEEELTVIKEDVIEKIFNNEEKEYDNSYSIDDEKVEEILNKIHRLEEKKYFLKQDCTLHNMAKKLKTNTSYLSKIINTHLNKSFSTYINELRINYAILEIKNNRRLRAYSVKGIAQEMGYKNADSFSKYFKAATGISPSVYVNKIKNTKNV